MILEAVPEVGSAAPAGSVGVAGRRPGGQDPSGGAATLRKLPALLLAQDVTQCIKRVVEIAGSRVSSHVLLLKIAVAALIRVYRGA